PLLVLISNGVKRDLHSALKSWISNVDTACGSDTKYNISRNPQTASYGGHELLWKQTASCLESSSGELCNLVIQQAAADKDTNVLCSSCALQYLTTVANSEWGQMILDPEVVSSQIDSCSATATYSVTYTASTATTSTTAPTVTSNDRCNVTDPDTITYTIQGNETCLDISASKNVSTPALRTVNNLDVGCAYLMSGQVLCLPVSCETYLVRTNDTCDSITASLLRSVSTSTFRSCNPWINSACSNMNSLVGQYLCISPPGTSEILESFPLLPATTAVAVPTDAVTTSNTDCGQWYSIKDDETCQTVASKFGIDIEDFYFLNPQLGQNCSSLWLGNSYCVQAVGSIQTYSGYNTSSAYTTLDSTINPSSTLTVNRTTTSSHFFYSFPDPTTTTMIYDTSIYELARSYTLCSEAMAYYNITGDTQFTDQMYDDAERYSEYQRVCLVDPTALPTSPFNTSIVLSTTEGLAVTSSTPAITKASATLTSSATSTSTGTSTTATPTPTVTISPNGLCGTANHGVAGHLIFGGVTLKFRSCP
ncbi:uncharacterized protein N7515_000474, partial [Penicillium bovifimosum]